MSKATLNKYLSKILLFCTYPSERSLTINSSNLSLIESLDLEFCR